MSSPPPQRWNRIYREQVGFSLAPNRLLMEAVRGVKPSEALDLAMGQGRNALSLASQGWRVTGVDISDEGLRLARRVAGEEHLPLTSRPTCTPGTSAPVAGTWSRTSTPAMTRT